MLPTLVISVAAWIAVIAVAPTLLAQQGSTPTTGAAAANQTAAAAVPDLSGPWVRGQGGFGSSLSLSDPRQAKRGYEDDIPDQPWAREKTLSERTSTGPEAQYDNSTNPQMWCDPVGAPAVYGWPAKNRVRADSHGRVHPLRVRHQLPHRLVEQHTSRGPGPAVVGTLDRLV